MRVLVTATHVPFVQGGAEAHMAGLVRAFAAAGHEAELLRLPFRFWPETAVHEAMRFCAQFDLAALSGPSPDLVVGLQFPTYGMVHPNQVVWVMHQHRAVYELLGNVVPETPEILALRDAVKAFDARAFAQARRLFANSRRVAQRMEQFNGVAAEPLYHPPPDAERFRCAGDEGYVFFPSRLEHLKRQWLLIEAARLVRSPVRFVLTGKGGQEAELRRLIDRYGLADRVWLRGHCSRAEQLGWYAHALAVFFGPHDEDLGYVTLEAMLAAKPVITCTDSGGPLEFVVDGETGWVVPPEPEAVAEAVEAAWGNRARARAMGEAGRARYAALGIGWPQVVARLLGEG